MKIENTEPLER